MRIHRIIPVSRVNGPGERFVVWVQGCSRSCPGCFNPPTHDKNGGSEMTADEIIRQAAAGRAGGLTVSGGEPFEQVAALRDLLEAAGEAGLHRLVYTGYTLDELTSLNDETVRKCLTLTDILIDGAFMKDVPPVHPWTGSGNQRVLILENGNVRRELRGGEQYSDGEIIIDRTGNIISTGLIDGGALWEDSGADKLLKTGQPE